MLSINRIYTIDVLDGLRHLDEGCIQCCITSPPYYRQRNYGIAGQIGQESSPEQYLGNLATIFEEVKRVLAPTGTLWVNLGDGYRGTARIGISKLSTGNQPPGDVHFSDKLHNKSLLGLPWRLAFLLQQQGWILRQDIIWAKKNSMPESITDRCTRAHEYIFMFSKQAKYFYDADAVKTPTKQSSLDRMERGHPNSHKYSSAIPGTSAGQQIHRVNKKTDLMGVRHAGFDDRYRADIAENGARAFSNLRSVWHLGTKPLKDAHFAAFPIDIPTTCIKAGTKPGDLVLDIFMGSGTTALAAVNLQRNFIGFELNPEYTKIAENRLQKHMGLFYMK